MGERPHSESSSLRKPPRPTLPLFVAGGKLPVLAAACTLRCGHTKVTWMIEEAQGGLEHDQWLWMEEGVAGELSASTCHVIGRSIAREISRHHSRLRFRFHEPEVWAEEACRTTPALLLEVRAADLRRLIPSLRPHPPGDLHGIVCPVG